MISPELRALVKMATDAQSAAGLTLPPPRPGVESRQAWVETVVAQRALWDQQALALADGATPLEVPVEEVRDVSIEVVEGTIAARCYLPHAPSPRSAIVFYHGGGFWMGGGETAFVFGDLLCRLIAANAGAVVLNVDYRLAPEHRYPTSIEDAYAALQWTHDHACELGVDTGRIGLMGISSGGNLAAVVARRSRERGGPKIRQLVLLVPALDLSEAPGSLHEPEISDGLDPEAMRQLIELYLEPDADRNDPDISPARDPDMRGLPPAFVVTGEHDALRPQGEAYAERLREAGVEATARRYPMTHSVALPETVAEYTADLLAAIERGLADQG